MKTVYIINLIMYRPDNLVIDNDKLKLFDELNKILQEQKVVDIASGYFNIAGVQLIINSLSNVEKLRLLIGCIPAIEDKKPDVFQPEYEYKQNIRQDLEDEKFEKDKKETVIKILELLKREEAEVRIYTKSFFHGKAYIFDKLAIVGSSNLTFSGLTSNTELNAVLDEAHSKYIKEEWFEKFWRESEDFKDDLIKILDESKFGTKEYTPYQIFIKSLYELQKDDILFEYEKPEVLPDSEVDLANFQEDAVKRIYSRLKTYNGVLVADSVGLGKTWIAKKIIEDFGFYRRKRFLVICPASVDETLWRPELKAIGVSENILHMEALGKENIDFTEIERELNFKLEDVALIVIDESHNFRNPISNRYENLFTLIEKASVKNKPKVLLLTATPMNNTYWDLYFQIMLIARNNKRIFFKEGIFDIEKEFKKADKGNVSNIGDILQIISIRRPRQYIIENYPDAKYKDEQGNWVKIEFPERKLKDINYSLDETYQGLYYKIAGKIEKELTLAYYRLEEYRITGKKDEMELGRMKALGGILQTILLKRLESSVSAFRRSIQSQINFLNSFKDFFLSGKILRKKFYDKYIFYLESDNETKEDIASEIDKNLEQINLDEFNKEKFLQDLEYDINIFTELEKIVAPIDEKQDAKLQELKKKILELKDKGRILLFSFYADTIDYLHQALTEDKEFISSFEKKIEKITGSFSTKRRREIIDTFLNRDIGLLLSTDILSEGQNLQKARIVINYDLHWNPVRMIQRAGRIDRIGSPYKEIYIYNFYPEKELESLLELVKILQTKIEKIDQTVGLDASILGEKINPKVFGIIRELKGTEKDKENVLKELEEEQFGGGELFWQPLKDFGLEKLKEFCDEIPYGVQSGLKNDYKIKKLEDYEGFRGIFFYYKYLDDYHLWYLYDAIQDRFITTKTEIVNFISCKENEKRVISDNLDIFEIHKKVRDEIKRFFSEGLIALHVKTAHGRMEKTLRDMRDELTFIRDEYLDENDSLRTKIDEIIDFFTNISFTKKRIQTLRKIWKEYRNSENWRKMVAELLEFLKEKIAVDDEEEPVEFDENKLKLICVQFVS